MTTHTMATSGASRTCRELLLHQGKKKRKRKQDTRIELPLAPFLIEECVEVRAGLGCDMISGGVGTSNY